jgi:hypothetical protein
VQSSIATVIEIVGTFSPWLPPVAPGRFVDFPQMTLQSASGILFLLDEPSNELKIHALKKLDQMVDLYWSEIADQITKMYYNLNLAKFCTKTKSFLNASLQV